MIIVNSCYSLTYILHGHRHDSIISLIPRSNLHICDSNHCLAEIGIFPVICVNILGVGVGGACVVRSLVTIKLTVCNITIIVFIGSEFWQIVAQQNQNKVCIKTQNRVNISLYRKCSTTYADCLVVFCFVVGIPTAGLWASCYP